LRKGDFRGTESGGRKEEGLYLIHVGGGQVATPRPGGGIRKTGEEGGFRKNAEGKELDTARDLNPVVPQEREEELGEKIKENKGGKKEGMDARKIIFTGAIWKELTIDWTRR